MNFNLKKKSLFKKGVMLSAASGLLYGLLGWLGITIINSGSSVINMLFWRFSLASLMLFLMLPLVSRVSLTKELVSMKGPLWLHLGISVFFSSCSTVTYFLAAQRIGTGLGMIIFFSFPAVVVLLSWIYDNQRPSLITLVALIGITIGCILVASGEENTHFDSLGVGFAIFSALAYSLFMFWNKRALHHVNSTLATGLVCAGNGIVLAIIAFSMGSLTWLNGISIWMVLIALSLLATALPMLFLLQGMKYITASLAAILSVLEPLVTLTIGIFILHEPATSLQLVGAAIILTSAVLAQRKSKMPTEL